MTTPDVQEQIDKNSRRVLELEMAHKRLRDEIAHDFESAIGGVKVHIATALEGALGAVKEDLKLLISKAEDSERERKFRKAWEQEQFDRNSAGLDHRKKEAEVEHLTISTRLAPLKNERDFRIALVVAAGGFLATLGGLIAALWRH